MYSPWQVVTNEGHTLYVHVPPTPESVMFVRFLRDADWVVVMEGGRVDRAHSGPPDTVLPWLEQQEQLHTATGTVGGGREEGETSGDRERRKGEGDSEGETPLDTTVDLCGAEPRVCPSSDGTGGEGREHALVQEEEKEVGVVALSVYLTYWAAVGSVLAPAIFLALFLMQGL